MAEVKELLVTLLESYGYPVFLQGTLHEDEAYPDSFFTYFNNDTYDRVHYDNDALDWVWDFDVNFYSTDVVLVNTKLLEAIALLRENGFIISGKGYDVMSDEPTHTGRGVNALFVEKNKKEA